MVKHIILWTLKDMSAEEKERVKAGIKEGLEGLQGKIPGMIDIKVNSTGRLETSTVDLMLDSTFESREALATYSQHPAHVEVADTKVRPFTASRACLDYEV
ncbi:MAG: Dabb family protein [Lachnospiraceae bacterium]|nr:Dabb family protein [Lachnospiraceae bacterium]